MVVRYPLLRMIANVVELFVTFDEVHVSQWHLQILEVCFTRSRRRILISIKRCCFAYLVNNFIAEGDLNISLCLLTDPSSVKIASLLHFFYRTSIF